MPFRSSWATLYNNITGGYATINRMMFRDTTDKQQTKVGEKTPEGCCPKLAVFARILALENSHGAEVPTSYASVSH